MRRSIPILCSFLCIIIHCVQSQNWTHYTILDDRDVFHLSWNPPEDKGGESEITFKVEVAAKGYFGLGFSPNGGMPGSDIVTGWITGGEIYFQDRHATAFSLPPKDEQQDYELIDAYENDTFTVFEFRRKLDTCDQNDMVIDENPMTVIYAFSNEDSESGDPFYHGENRGVKNVQILQNEVRENPKLNYTSLLTWDVLSPGVDISSFHNLYWCKVYKAPEVSEKNHIVLVKPVFEEGHQQFVHHMAIYECLGGTADELERHVSRKGEECRLPTMPIELMKCTGFTISWSVGGEDIVLPEHVGLPMFPGPETYYMLEMHYTNPQLMNGIIDHSGFRFYYTPDLREFDAGNIMVGVPPVIPRIFIPPSQNEYVLVGHTSPPCVPWAEDAVKVLAVAPHAHMLARKFKARHFRGNQELTPLVDDKNFNINYQDYRFYRKEIDLMPGDQITIECTYNSSQKTNVTFGGETTDEEMCMGFILHYPLVRKYPAFSAPSFANINKVLGTNITSEMEAFLTLGSYDWRNADIDSVQNVMRYSEHETACNFGYIPEDGVNPLVSYPKDLKPYEPQSTCNVAS